MCESERGRVRERERGSKKEREPIVGLVWTPHVRAPMSFVGERARERVRVRAR